ncbi:hypothetical protein A5881_001375 [Enterococcus termitis]
MINREDSKKLLLVAISALIVVMADKLWAVQINFSVLLILLLIVLILIYLLFFNSKN